MHIAQCFTFYEINNKRKCDAVSGYSCMWARHSSFCALRITPPDPSEKWEIVLNWITCEMCDDWTNYYFFLSSSLSLILIVTLCYCCCRSNFLLANNNGISCAVEMVTHIRRTCRMSLNRFHITGKRSFSVRSLLIFFSFSLFSFYTSIVYTYHTRYTIYARFFLFIYFSTHLVPHPVYFTSSWRFLWHWIFVVCWLCDFGVLSARDKKKRIVFCIGIIVSPSWQLTHWQPISLVNRLTGYWHRTVYR